MDRKAILQKINEIILDLNKQYQEFETQPEAINEIDLELFIANAKFLADHALILQRIGQPPVAVQEEPVSEIAEAHEPIAVAAPYIETIEMPLEPEIMPETVVKDQEAATPTVNDLMAGRLEVNLASKLGSEPIADLKSIISLNDKLVFIKDLFSGYSLAYQEAIDTLNRSADFKSADEYLQANYVGQYKWSEKTKTVDKFYELLNRRFPK
ncbi:MAG: hypothetical protein ACKOW2_04790 [Sphingobacteriaceae bacterium]